MKSDDFRYEISPTVSEQRRNHVLSIWGVPLASAIQHSESARFVRTLGAVGIMDAMPLLESEINPVTERENSSEGVISEDVVAWARREIAAIMRDETLSPSCKQLKAQTVLCEAHTYRVGRLHPQTTPELGDKFMAAAASNCKRESHAETRMQFPGVEMLKDSQGLPQWPRQGQRRYAASDWTVHRIQREST